MNNDKSAGRKQSGNLGQRVLALLVLVFMGYLIWLAMTGRYDAHVDHFATWLHRHYESLRHMF